MTRQIVRYSFRWLPFAFILALAGIFTGIALHENPLQADYAVQAFYIGLAPLLAMLGFRFLYNLLAPTKNTMDRAGRAAAWLGAIELVPTTIMLSHTTFQGDLTTFPQMGYGLLVMLGVVIMLTGDLLRHYEVYRRGMDAV